MLMLSTDAIQDPQPLAEGQRLTPGVEHDTPPEAPARCLAQRLQPLEVAGAHRGGGLHVDAGDEPVVRFEAGASGGRSGEVREEPTTM